jgi:L,D-peptidoglycan transpeptidase YkuD (ErfK/YbiS/YcfS/YnhG family)
MKIIVKNNTLSYDDFIFKCSIGKNGVSSIKVEGDKKTPKGLYSHGVMM